MLGPGPLKSVYETCLCHELIKRAIRYSRQHYIPVVFDGETLEEGFRIDLWVDEKVVVELKVVTEMSPLFHSQLITYLKLIHNRIGLFINFNVDHFKGAVKRIIL
ncbi:MAG: GxxExxY protein [Bacteroidetes bacterium]|nr:GxxExxY protein [Bacteroidota bacterium]